ncbi:MAG: glycosyltransferase, partial [Terriglobales bacterium]
MALAQGQHSPAVACLQRATQAAGPGAAVLVGSGGESGYRAHCLLATLADAAGSQNIALHHFLTGLRHSPAYPPSVAGVLRQRVPTALFGAVEFELSRLGRREPAYQAAIVDFFLLHRAFAAVERLLATWPLDTGAQQRLAARLAGFAPLYRPSTRPPGARAGLMIEGPLLMHSSVAQINRQLAAALQADARFDLWLEPTLPGEQPEAAFPGPAGWRAAWRRLPARLDLTIRHGWPPNFEPPPAGKLALILPWELGAIPRAWLRQLPCADAIWVPSEFVRQVLIRAGAAGERVAVIPNAVALDQYTPAGAAIRPAGTRAVSFLFVGGAIER